MSLSEFLLARIAEDEADALQIQVALDRFDRERAINGPDGRQGSIVVSLLRDGPCDPARVLRECDLKRQLVKMHGGNHECPSLDDETGWWTPGDLHYDMEVDSEVPCPECPTLRAAGAVYVDHSDYQLEWRR